MCRARIIGSNHYLLQITIFTCATVLLINVWNARRMGLAADTAKDLKDVQRADFILSQFEKRCVKSAASCCT